jgi:hypothetical protein
MRTRATDVENGPMRSSPGLEAAVAELLGEPVLRVTEARREPIEYDAFLAGRTLNRVRGIAATRGGTAAWSFIEKVTEGPEAASAYLYDNGRREFDAYRSGLLDDLAPGLVAPRLLGSTEAADGALTLWLEAVGEQGRARLTSTELLTAARHLGRLGGRWLGRVPDAPWLFRGWVDRHRQPEAVATGRGVVAAALDRRNVARALGDRIGEALELIDAQRELPAILERLPQTLCHHDAVAANVYARVRDGELETVLIDWESIGPGPVGADLASLLFSSARRGDIATRTAHELTEAALGAYAAGLADMGAEVGLHLLAAGFHGAVALRWTLVRDVIRALGEPARTMRGSAPHESPAESLGELTALVSMLLDSARRVSLRDAGTVAPS